MEILGQSNMDERCKYEPKPFERERKVNSILFAILFLLSVITAIFLTETY